jgi:thiol-disulfide isomerase/thioredoxin
MQYTDCIMFRMKIAVAIVLLPFLRAPAAEPAPDPTPPDLRQKIQRFYSQAVGFYRSKEHRKSIDSYLEVLALIPERPDTEVQRMRIHYSIAANHALLGEEDKAFASIEKAIECGLVDMAPLNRNNDFARLRGTIPYKEIPNKMGRRLQVEQKRRLDGIRGFDFSLTSIDGKPLRKSDFLGQVLIVDIWGTWCGPCRMEIPHFVELHRKYADKGLRIVGLNQERVPPGQAAETVRKFVAEQKVPYPCAIVTPEILRSIPNFRSLPTTLFFGRDGSPRGIEMGALQLAQIEAMVKPLLEEKTPAGKSGPASPGGSVAPAPAPVPASPPAR